MPPTSFDFEQPIAEIETELDKIEKRLAKLPQPEEAPVPDEEPDAEPEAAEEGDVAVDLIEEAEQPAEASTEEAADAEAAPDAEGAEAETPAEGEDAEKAADEKPVEKKSKAELKREAQLEERERLAKDSKRLRRKLQRTRKEVYANLTPWQRVQIARHLDRPHMLDYIQMMFTEWSEVHGDRFFGDDKAMVAGFAFFDGQPCAVIGQQKGSQTRENVERNFAMAHPEGYRKALRVMKLASKFGRPIIVLVDTPGAFPGIGAEERGIAEAIAKNIKEMFSLEVPVIVVIIGEGASGGAIGIGVGDAVLMLENSWYTVISPEGCASILWRDAKMAPRAAEALKLTGEDLLELEIVDEVVPEPLGGAHLDPDAAASTLKQAIAKHLSELRELPVEELHRRRFDKFRKIGKVTTTNA